MVRLTTCGDAFEARLLAARLGADGIIWALRGGHDGPLSLGSVDVLVAADDAEVARALLAGDDEAPIGPDGRGDVRRAEARAPTASAVLAVAVTIVLVVCFALARMGARV